MTGKPGVIRRLARDVNAIGRQIRLNRQEGAKAHDIVPFFQKVSQRLGITWCQVVIEPKEISRLRISGSSSAIGVRMPRCAGHRTVPRCSLHPPAPWRRDSAHWQSPTRAGWLHRMTCPSFRLCRWTMVAHRSTSTSRFRPGHHPGYRTSGPLIGSGL